LIHTKMVNAVKYNRIESSKIKRLFVMRPFSICYAVQISLNILSQNQEYFTIADHERCQGCSSHWKSYTTHSPVSDWHQHNTI
jgi:hypothetical protein